MKKTVSIVFLVFAGLTIFAQKTINDANAEVRQVSSFHAIRISSSFDVHISQAGQEAVAVSASTKEYRDNIETKVENGTLIIRLVDEKKFWKRFGGDKMKLKAYISVKNLDKLVVSGACEVHMEDGIKADELAIHLSGASDLRGKVETKKLILDLSGASDMDLSGTTSDLKVEASGASDFKAYNLQTDYCVASASGASSISITVNKELAAHASGASSVHYKGSGLIRDIKTSGASNVTRRS